MRRESKFGLLFKHWIRANPPLKTSHYELKQTEDDSIPFNHLESHQVTYGEALRDSPEGVLMRNMSGNGEPDYTYSYKDPVYIVIKFPDSFSIMSLDTFEFERRISLRKSLTSMRAREIAVTTVDL